MGMLRFHTCPGCGYEEQVSGGGDGGMTVSTLTFVCVDCQILTDCVVMAQSPDYGYDSNRTNWVKRYPRCPKCRRTRCLREWKSGDPCPKCGVPMPADSGQGGILWD